MEITTPRLALVAPWADQRTFGRNIFVPLRIVLALSVVLSHSFPLIYGDNAREPLFRLVGVTFGDIAVDLFLAISGFLVSRSWETSTTTCGYLAKRCLRVYPAFAVLMLVQAFVLAPLVCAERFTGYSLKDLGIIVFDAFDLMGYGYPHGKLLTTFPHNPFPYALNGSLWTIRYEFVCYLVLMAFGVKGKRLWPCAGSFLVVLLVYFSGKTLHGNTLSNVFIGYLDPWPRLLSFFLAGVLFYRFRSNVPCSNFLALAALVAVVLTAACSLRGLGLVLPTFGVYLLLFVAYHPLLQPISRLFYADPSYGTYLYGFPVQQSIVYLVGTGSWLGPGRLALIAMTLSLLIGTLSWHLVEKRFLALKRRAA